jgi:hypothetical protein
MRKVLLTTTALVALGGVSAASAIDISGSYGVEYYSESNTGGSADAADVSGDDFIDDGLIVFSGSTTSDSGLTFGGRMTLNHAGGIEDQQMTISGDFGTFMAGAQDGMVDSMDGFMQGSDLIENGASTDNGGSDGVGLYTSSMVADNPGTEKVGFKTNVMSGFQAGFSYEDAGEGATNNNDVTAWIVTYDLGVAKLGYAKSDTGSTTTNGANLDQSQVGIGTSLAGVTIAASWGSAKQAGANGAPDTSKIDTRDVGLSYSIDDSTGIYAAFTNSEEKTGTNAGDKMSSSTFGLSYTIAPGVTSLLETASADYTDATAGSGNSDGLTQTTAKIKVSF